MISYEKLSDDIQVCVSKEHRFGTDAFLLSNFANHKSKDIVCDFGTGCGIIPMILSKHNPPKKIYGIDIQEQAIEQFKNSIIASNINNDIEAINIDIKELLKSNHIIENCSVDLITCNPPYKIAGRGILNDNDAASIARHEISCTIDDICKTAKRLLRFGGRFCLCQRPERLGDVIIAMKSNDIEPKRVRFVSKNTTSAPWLFLIEGKKSSKPFMQVMEHLYVYEDNSSEYTKQMQAIYSVNGNFDKGSDR